MLHRGEDQNTNKPIRKQRKNSKECPAPGPAPRFISSSLLKCLHSCSLLILAVLSRKEIIRFKEFAYISIYISSMLGRRSRKLGRATKGNLSPRAPFAFSRVRASSFLYLTPVTQATVGKAGQSVTVNAVAFALLLCSIVVGLQGNRFLFSFSKLPFAMQGAAAWFSESLLAWIFARSEKPSFSCLTLHFHSDTRSPNNLQGKKWEKESKTHRVKTNHLID